MVFKSGNENNVHHLWGSAYGERKQIKWKHLKKHVFGGNDNLGLSPDYRMACSIHIEFVESLGREIGRHYIEEILKPLTVLRR